MLEVLILLVETELQTQVQVLEVLVVLDKLEVLVVLV